MNRDAGRIGDPFGPFNYSPRAKLVIAGIVIAPVVSVGLIWAFLAGLSPYLDEVRTQAVVVLILMCAVGTLIAHGRTRSIQRRWIAAAVVAYLPMTAAVGALSVFVALVVSCGDRGCG